MLVNGDALFSVVILANEGNTVADKATAAVVFAASVMKALRLVFFVDMLYIF
jgi:hypothetical protein